MHFAGVKMHFRASDYKQACLLQSMNMLADYIIIVRTNSNTSRPQSPKPKTRSIYPKPTNLHR